MLEHFDVFQRRSDGSPKWIASVATLDEAKRMVKGMAESDDALDFFVHDFLTGKDVWHNTQG
jgi:hypothetical protein